VPGVPFTVKSWRPVSTHPAHNDGQTILNTASADWKTGSHLGKLVGLVRRYSNRADLQERLAQASRRVACVEFQDQEQQVSSVSAQASGVWRLRDRLTDENVRAIAERFQAGTSKRELAAQFDLSMSSVKNLLRQLGVRRTNKS
jgi:uncharacterized protein (DUF433 family)